MSVFVLIVEDDLDCARITEAILVARGFETAVVHDGASAIAAVARRPPDVVLLDVMMPAMSGIAVLEHLKAQPGSARIPVVVVTAKGADDDILDGYAHGADYYVRKPYTARQLLHGVGLVLGRDLLE